MKQLSMFVFLIALALPCLAGDWASHRVSVEYLLRDTTETDPSSYAFCATERGIELEWKTKTIPKPTLAQLDAILPTALAWKSNQVAEVAADIDKLEIKHVLRALVKTLNKRLPADKQVTEDELKAAIKAEVTK